MPESRLQQSFFTRDVLAVAPEILGNYLVRKFDDGFIYKFLITEVEAYRGEEDLACHASKGKTARTEIMYHEGGHLYVYLIYGMYWMLNIVTGTINNPQAILIRGIQHFDGPGKLTKHLKIDKSFYGENLISSDRIWIEPNINTLNVKYTTSPRVGIDYAGEIWKNKPWRYILTD
ncbi:MAG: 3-methyladenine DNA glycosylase [Bacteroidetes bacterium GWF2_33_16]|nr:MAG: 3-methyladenine DNA glycosylase [Bacteroidetes bacterium GWE2_32_14]OFY03705.1 MAG: 3-methyladenine DNA glycosylase [Bacteroidetes bacterium GWF2_33_16]